MVVTLVGCKAQQEAEPVEYGGCVLTYTPPTEDMWREIVERGRERRNASNISGGQDREEVEEDDQLIERIR